MSEVRISGLEKAFGAEVVLDGLDLDIPDRSLTAVLGPSGSGKTTLLRVLAGFETPDAGRVEIGDLVVVDGEACLPPERRRVGYVPQEGALFPHLNVAKNVGFGLPRGPERAERVAEALELVGMERYAHRSPHELSGGQQQRVALARALAPRPQLLLLDEPFSSLDAQMRAELRVEVAALLRATGTTSVLVTHDQDEALSIADHVAILVLGRIRQSASPRSLYTDPVARRIARFVGVANFLVGEVVVGGVHTAFGDLEVRGPIDDPLGSRVVVMIRPERLEIERAGTAEAPALVEGEVEGSVSGVEYHGHDALVFVEPAIPEMIAQRTRSATPDGPNRPPPPITELVVRTDGEEAYERGEQVRIRALGPVVAWPEPIPLIRRGATA